MAKRKPAGSASLLFVDAARRRHVKLFLPKLLETEANRAPLVSGSDEEKAMAALRHWADLAEAGHLQQKETSLDAEFLEKIFGDVLGYRSVTESPAAYNREKNPSVVGAGIADGALGHFASGKPFSPMAIIELKGADTDLDHDKSSGRTPVQQCWDYLNQLPDCPWGIVSNYITIRLYHRAQPARAYEEFTVNDFRNDSRLRQFYYLFSRDGLIGNRLQPPRALALLRQTQARQREVGDELYAYYSEQRIALIDLLVVQLKLAQEQAIAAAQRLLDRVIFMAFCEDRGLLPEGLIRRTWANVAPLARATNPRWRNFLDAFHAIDKGHPELDLPTGYNGGLFKHNELVDNLDLDDRWAEVFKNIGEFDFRDEVNVDVLGHLFERSVTELEKLRVVGLFGRQAEGDGLAAMPKSAERKRFGIYYTPPAFTRLIVDNTVGRLVQDRIEPLADLDARVTALRELKVVDPACGSGAFLIAAYDKLEDAYSDVTRALRLQGRSADAEALDVAAPDYILADNLYGVDLSAESVEITQLALWIRSARKGRALSNLSGNIVCGNSLVRDVAVHPRAFNWRERFAAVFQRPQAGFDAVIGNPPWERMKLQEREFFSLASPKIAAAVNAADRRKLTAALEAGEPALWTRYQEARAAAERTLNHVRTSGDFPLTGRGDVNTYMLFAELARTLVAPDGRVGLVIPSGIATDDTTKDYFASIVESQSLVALYDFENKSAIFPDVHRSFKFSVLLLGGAHVKTECADFVFFARSVEELAERRRHIALSAKDLRLLNPNTRTCPIFRSERDATLTKQIYRRVPILIDHNRRSGGNPWGVRFVRMFDQTNDAEMFRSGAELQAAGLKLERGSWVGKDQRFLPLYEAKMVQAFDHRAASVVVAAGNWMRQGQPEETALVEHQNPEFVVTPRYWVSEAEVEGRVRSAPPALLGFKDITSATNQRTMIAAFIPRAASVNHFVLVQASLTPQLQCCLLGNLNSLVFDYVARQKVGGITLNFFIVEQLPTLSPDRYDEPCPWDAAQTLRAWVSERVLKLTCTAEDMVPLAEAAGFAPPIHRWRDDERARLRAELDAAYFHLYGIGRADVEYILSTFQGIAKEDESHGGVGPTRRLVLAAFDARGQAAR